MNALGKRSRACISTAAQCVQIAQTPRVYLYTHDIERISDELRGSGFDLGRGFKICGVKVEGVVAES